jgi:Flp pilus assembly protein TadG
MTWSITMAGLKFRDSERGSALVELALTIPMLLVVALGVADFARVFYFGNEVTAASRAAVQYGGYTTGNAGDTATMTTDGNAGAFNTTVTVSPVRKCYCVTDAGAFSLMASCTSACGNHVALFAEVTTTKTFTSVSRGLFGLPSTISLSRTVTMRAPN